jgi:hypothetical protein
MTVRRLTVAPVSANIRRDAAAMPGRTETVSLATLRETRAMLGNVRKSGNRFSVRHCEKRVKPGHDPVSLKRIML